MTSIFVLEDGLRSVSEALPEELRTQLARLVGERYPVELSVNLPALQARLVKQRQAVVFFSAPSADALSIVDACRTLTPGVAFVEILQDAQAQDFSVFGMDCHFLPLPLDDFTLMGQLSSAIRQGELLATLADSSQIDEVTNLFNRRYFMQRLSEEISLSRRHLSPFCCVVVGIPLYQMYLDSYGYNFINALLRFLGDRVSGMVRHEDIVARIGDGEIAILLSRSTEKGAKVFTGRMVKGLNALVFKYGAYEEEVLVCAGVAGFPLPEFSGADADTMVRYARHALHQAKTSENPEEKVQLFSEIHPAF
jgi:diguanylate cyclase (GGDEF)-like protein